MGEGHREVFEEPKDQLTEWARFSSSEDHSYEEIRSKAILDAMYNYKSELSIRQLKKLGDHSEAELCYSYLSEHFKFTEDQIEEMMVITSPLFRLMDFKLDDQPSIDAILSILQVGYDDKKQRERIAEILDNEEIALPKKFKIKLANVIEKRNGVPKQGYQDKLDWDNIDKYQNISSEFRVKWANLFRNRDASPHVYNPVYYSSSIIRGSSNKTKRNNKR